ncbi:group III truncated hemoglobin [Pontibacter cellulosilyticus]|uniref:Group III truncated hemoglobin n=1 Tax=Pontibacter cellulosilyticus TaxID=1720253 RepID=A0A923SLB6_9BACT|nr:group III truncated hemoglobin [Pontibacter cellulosilyticus]MBC5994706.1 group III truncated hemoglobin [Pontibacter cellulosilyticus]
MKRELENEEDIKLLVDTFYDAVNQDKLLAPVFNGHAKVVWENHLPLMYTFWSTVLLGSMSYKGYPFQKHMNLPIGQVHFSRWVELFTQTIDELFEGEKAAEAKHKATNIAQVFQLKMGILDPYTRQAAV